MLVSAEQVKFWCHDCRQDSFLEVAIGGADQIPREWAYITCGAACIEADIRGVA